MQLFGTVTDSDGNPVGTGALGFVEDEDGVRVTVDGRSFFLLAGVTLAEVDQGDFVVNPPVPTAVAA
jgi:hypothetical protein